MKKTLTYDDISIVPQYSEILSRSNCDLTTRLSKHINIDIPIVAAPMDTVCEWEMAVELARLGGMGFIHRFMDINDQCKQIAKVKEHGLRCCGTIGVGKNAIRNAYQLEESGAIAILIDVAHGDHILVHNVLKELKKKIKIDIIVGNICTEESAENLIELGADALRVGVGGGSNCLTRIRTGIGVPNATAISDIAEKARSKNVPIIADGGIRFPGDVVKAIGLGASSVMLGSLIAATKETPGEIQKTGEWPNEFLYKKYRGSASFESKADRGEEGKNVEGDSAIYPYRGHVSRIISDILDGLRSGMSYCNSIDIRTLQKNARFVEITHAGMIEGTAHAKKRL